MGKLGIKFNKNVFAAGAAKHAESPSNQENVELAPGRYTCILRQGRPVEVKGVAKVVFDLTVAGEAEQAGGRISIWTEMSEEKMHQLLKLLDRVGYDISDLDEDKLADILEDLKANPKVVRVTAKVSGDYTNYYIDKVIEDLTVAEASGGASAPEKEVAADPEAAGGKAGLKPGKGKQEPAAEPEAEVEPEPEPEAEPEADELAELDREMLKKIAKVEATDLKIFKNTTDDAIRDAIRAARAAAAEPVAEETEPEPEPEAEVELAVGMKVTVTIRGKDIPGAIVKSIDEKAGKVKVQLPDKSLATINPDQIAV